MKAFAITARDSQPALQDLPQPQPAAGEVLAEVEAASVNGFDLSVAAGYVWDMLPHEFPVVLGRDLVGTVTAAGNVEAGDRVAGVIPGVALGPRTGSFAEQVSLPASAVTRVPSGVGSIALQLAVAAGATVIATARPGQEEEYVRGLGAAHTVDYAGDVAAAVRAIVPHGADKALHAAGDAAAIGKVMRAGGRVASTLAATAGQLGRDDVTVTAIMAAATAGKLARLLDHVASGNLRVHIEARVPLDRAHEALTTFAGGTLGKVLITR